jgi:hypothetical protein
MEKMRKKRYEEREKRLVLANFMEMVKKKFPFSTTKNVQMTWKEMNFIQLSSDENSRNDQGKRHLFF